MDIEASSRVASAAVNGKHGNTLISDATFRRLYELALRCEQRGGGNAMAAALAGVAANLRPDDAVLAQEPALVAPLIQAEGAPSAGPRDVRAYSERIIAALSSALADRLRKNRRVTVILGEGVSDPILREAYQIAEEARLAVIFIEDGRAAGRSGAVKKAAGPLPQRIGAMPAIPVDAQDVIALYRVAYESIARAREGGGPTRMQCVPWPAANASDKTESHGSAVGHLTQWLKTRGLPVDEWRRTIAAELEAERAAGRHGFPGDEEIHELRTA